jgi:hypothetical protein
MARTTFFYGVTGITPAMAMRMTGIGSQYLLGGRWTQTTNYFDELPKTYKVTLPQGFRKQISGRWTLYDNQTRSTRCWMTPQRFPRAE